MYGLHFARIRGMKAVIHRRGEPQRDVMAVGPGARIRVWAEEVCQGVRKPLRLKHLPIDDLAASANDCIARARHHLWIVVDRASAITQFANEAIVKAVEMLFFSFA